jgi:hypothetical protein
MTSGYLTFDQRLAETLEELQSFAKCPMLYKYQVVFINQLTKGERNSNDE